MNSAFFPSAHSPSFQKYFHHPPTQMVTESFVSPQHFSPAPVCIFLCTMTTKLRLNMLLQLTVFGLKYLVHQVHTR